MKKDLSYKQRQEKRRIRNMGIVMTGVVLLLIAGIIIDFSLKGESNNTYTAAEMLHDHDGDGIPDH